MYGSYSYPYYQSESYEQVPGYYPSYMQPSYQKQVYHPISLPSSLAQTSSPDTSPQAHYEAKGVSKRENSILIASGFPEDISPYRIFRLFSLYGNVTKVKIMFK